MADPEERIEPDGGRPRRQPPIIEGEAVEISVDGSPAAPGSAAARAGKVLSDLMSLLALPKAAAFAFPKVTAAVAAGVAAVIIAAGASWLYFSGDGGVAPAPSDDITGRAASVADAAPATPDRIVVNTTPETDLENRLAAVNAALAAMNDRIAALDRSVRESAAAAARAEQAARAFDETKKSGDEQGAHDVDHGALDDLAGRLKTLESRQMTMLQIQDRLDRLDQLAGQAAATDKVVRSAVAATALRNAVERDRPFAAELAAARALGLDETVLRALEPFAAAGLPRQNVLYRELSTLLPELRRAAAPPGQDLGYLDRLQASAVRMLNIRPVKDAPGDNPAAVLSRIEYKMIHEDIDAIIPELDKLPAPAKEVAQPWRSRATARRAAVEAVRLIAAASLMKLGEPATNGSTRGSAPQ